MNGGVVPRNIPEWMRVEPQPEKIINLSKDKYVVNLRIELKGKYKPKDTFIVPLQVITLNLGICDTKEIKRKIDKIVEALERA